MSTSSFDQLTLAEIANELIPFLCCPTHKTELTFKSKKLISTTGTEYPFISHIPFLLTPLEHYRSYWLLKKQELLSSLALRTSVLDEKQKITSSPLTKLRLKQLSEAFAYNEKKMSELLSDFFPNTISSQEAKKTLHDFYVPSQQTLTLYLENIFRDFGDSVDGGSSSAENQLSLEICKKLFKDLPQPIESMAVLGAGSCRLALDLHLNLAVKKTLAIDFNPLLLMIAERMLTGKNLKLYEISSFPLSFDEVCREKILSYEHYKKISGFFPVLADFQNLPLKKEILDVVLTPWIIDILPLNFNQVIACISRILKTGGFWINHGPLGFMHSDPQEQLTSQEIKEKLSQTYEK